MQTIDEISIGRDGDMFTLTIYVYEPDDKPGEPIAEHQRYVIGLPDQFHTETQRTIGKWLDDADLEHAQQLISQRETSPWPYSTDALTHDAQGDTDHE